jgi:hypothetical protein
LTRKNATKKDAETAKFVEAILAKDALLQRGARARVAALHPDDWDCVARDYERSERYKATAPKMLICLGTRLEANQDVPSNTVILDGKRVAKFEL